MSKKRLGLQRGTADIWLPANEDDLVMTKEFKANQIIEFQVFGGQNFKQRSYKQLALLMAAIRVVVANTQDPNYQTIDTAKLALKEALQYYDPNVAITVPGTDWVIRKYRSFGYHELKHMEACNLFERAFIILADNLRIPVGDLIEAAMNREYPQGLP